jgi:parallel beta-helix repeat protein
MKKNILFVLLISILMSFSVFAADINVNTWTVDGTLPDNSLCVATIFQCKDIQSAINVAASGDIINVAAGIYSENINVGKSLTLKGASSSTVTVNALDSSNSVFTVTANSVNISGFTISGASGGGQAGIFLGAGVANCNISNNILIGNFDGIWLGSGSNHNILMDNTLSSNYQGFEVYISSYNTFTNNNASTNSNYGFKIDSGDHNTFTNNIANSNTKYGFYVVIGDGGGATHSTFTNNIANLNTQYGIRINGGSDNTLTGNTFDSNVLAGLRLKENIINLGVDNNTISGSPLGIDIDVSVADVTSWTLSNNKIRGNTDYGVKNLGTGTLNAKYNWWGDITGPYNEVNNPSGTGDSISDNVNFNPWYTNEDMSFGIQGSINENEEGYNELTLDNDLTLNLNGVNVDIPAGTIITGESGWDGTINAPTIKTILASDIIADAGYSASTDEIIEIGFPNIKLTFSQGVRILIPGKAGKDVGYTRIGGTFKTIKTECSSDSQDAIDSIPDEDCKIDVGSDLVIWTKHFTQFVTYTQTLLFSGSSGGGGGSSSGNRNVIINTQPIEETKTNKLECAKGYTLSERGECIEQKIEVQQNVGTQETNVQSNPVTGFSVVNFVKDNKTGTIVTLAIVVLLVLSYIYIKLKH